MFFFLISLRLLVGFEDESIIKKAELSLRLLFKSREGKGKKYVQEKVCVAFDNLNSALGFYRFHRKSRPSPFFSVPY